MPRARFSSETAASVPLGVFAPLVAVISIGVAFSGCNGGATYKGSHQPGITTGSQLQLPAGWTRFEPAPATREGAAYVWAGDELLMWGGCDTEDRDKCVATAGGYTLDPAGRAWGRIPPAPRPGSYAAPVWTGEEALFLNAEPGEPLQGQAYDPRDESWRTIASAPSVAHPGLRGDVRHGVIVWTGSELVVWGGGPIGRTGAAYDPADDSWRRIADAPLGLNLASGLWTGSEVLVFGSLLDRGNRAETRTSVGAAYDSDSDSWRQLQPSDLSPQATSAVWVKNRMVAWDYEPRSQEYDPVGDEWSERLDMPLRFSECYPESVALQSYVFAFYCGATALYDLSSNRWRRLRSGPTDAKIKSGRYSLRKWSSGALAAADDTVFLALDRACTNPNCRYGASLWAYRVGSRKTD